MDMNVKHFMVISIAALVLLGCKQNAKDMSHLTLTQEWDKTFPKSERVNHCKVTFHSRYGIELAAVDFLSTCEMVDPERIGIIGCQSFLNQPILAWAPSPDSRKATSSFPSASHHPEGPMFITFRPATRPFPAVPGSCQTAPWPGLCRPRQYLCRVSWTGSRCGRSTA